jgi:hypothetical protein
MRIRKNRLSESDLYLQKDRPRVSTPENDSRMSDITIPQNKRKSNLYTSQNKNVSVARRICYNVLQIQLLTFYNSVKENQGWQNG